MDAWEVAALPYAFGDRVADFTAPLASGETFTLSEELRKHPVVLEFFPLAFTGVCELQNRTFSEFHPKFKEAGAELYGVSVDSPPTLKEFGAKLGSTHGYISDFNKAIGKAFGVQLERLGPNNGVNNRAVFVIDKDMTVRYATVTSPKDPPDPQPALDAVRSMGS